MEYALGLIALGGIVTFVGFVLVGYGLSQPIPVDVVGYGTSLSGFAFLTPYIVWGIVLIGLGVLLGFLGAALKGPSREWSEIAPNPPSIPPRPEDIPRPQDIPPMRRCPDCGVHTYLSTCPECGHKVAVTATQ